MAKVINETGTVVGVASEPRRLVRRLGQLSRAEETLEIDRILLSSDTPFDGFIAGWEPFALVEDEGGVYEGCWVARYRSASCAPLAGVHTTVIEDVKVQFERYVEG